MTDTVEKAKALFFEGIQLFEGGQFAEAEERFEAALALAPGRVSILANLGATRVKLHRPTEALAVLDAALAADPHALDALCHRGAALGQLGRHEEAAQCHDRVLALDERNAVAWYQRGMTNNLLRRHEEALKAFDRLVQLKPEHGEAWLRHGQTLQCLGRHDQALVSYDKALSIDPTLGEAWSQRGGILRDAKRLAEAASSFEQALAHGADAELNRYFLASVAGADAPGTAPRRYVRFLFDDYAESYDKHLVEVLKYQAHAVLASGLEGLREGRFRAALDLGCGTGLCGPRVKALADRIDGVDLSASMLEKARELGVYEELAQADLCEHLQATPTRHDLVLAADVFIYVGDLAPVFAGVRRVLEPGGVFCFSIERRGDEQDFSLQASSRYTHSEGYIRSLAAQHGFVVEKIVSSPIREDQRQPVEGLFVYLSRP